MIPERYLNFLSEISGKFPIGNFGKLPRPIPTHNFIKIPLTILVGEAPPSPRVSASPDNQSAEMHRFIILPVRLYVIALVAPRQKQANQLISQKRL